jgi:hypothetical protein
VVGGPSPLTRKRCATTTAVKLCEGSPKVSDGRRHERLEVRARCARCSAHTRLRTCPPCSKMGSSGPRCGSAPGAAAGGNSDDSAMDKGPVDVLSVDRDLPKHIEVSCAIGCRGADVHACMAQKHENPHAKYWRQWRCNSRTFLIFLGLGTIFPVFLVLKNP